jgi:hypothetical protein
MRRRKGIPTLSPTPRPTLSDSSFMGLGSIGTRADVVGAGVVLEESGRLAGLVEVRVLAMKLLGANNGDLRAIVVVIDDEPIELELSVFLMNNAPLSKLSSP